MSSQDFMTTRRKFMQRSALGAGGLLFSSMLLASCTDHDIPDPQNPDFPPIGGVAEIDWNDDAKILVTSVIEMIPVAGDILGGLLDIFWPSTKEDIWGEMKAQVEALIEQDIAAAVYQQVSEDLTGLNNNIILYVNEVKEGSPSEILAQWMITKNFFVNALPHFQSVGNELPLVPLFGQFANMYLGLLRDAVAFGVSWGRTDADHQQDITDLQTGISDYTSYTTNTYNTGRSNLVNQTKADPHHNEPFQTVNTFDRQMTLTVLDFMNTWPYFDVTLYPNGTKYVSTREIYSDPMGTCDDSGNIVIATPVPTQLPTTLSVWSGSLYNAIQLTYPTGSGPGGVTTTKLMGASGGFNRVYNIPASNPIYSAATTYGSVVNTITFKYVDGTYSDVLGSVAGSNVQTFGYYEQVLSSVHINGVSSFYGSADCVVYGFQDWQSPEAILRAISAMYVKSPKERSVADFAKAFPKHAIPADLITEELKTARIAYWKYVKARVDEING